MGAWTPEHVGLSAWRSARAHQASGKPLWQADVPGWWTAAAWQDSTAAEPATWRRARKRTRIRTRLALSPAVTT